MLVASPKEYVYLFGALPSVPLGLVFGIEGVNTFVYYAPFSLIIFLIPNVVFYLKGTVRKTIYLLVSLYFFMSSAFGALIVLGQYY